MGHNAMGPTLACGQLATFRALVVGAAGVGNTGSCWVVSPDGPHSEAAAQPGKGTYAQEKQWTP